MKKSLFLLCLLMPCVVFADSLDEKSDLLKIKLDSLGIDFESQSGRVYQWLVKDLDAIQKTPSDDCYDSSTPRFCIYPTSNTWTFIKLDTRNGRLWQVQYSIEGAEYRFETPLSILPLVNVKDGVDGRFTLVETQNRYNFILLDQYLGYTYQVQWSIEEENRCVMPITFNDLD